MRKLGLLLLILILFPKTVNAISASSYVVMDQNSGSVLLSKNKDEKRLIASITKIMTAIIVIEHIDLNKEITVTEDVLKAYGSAIYIEMGEKIKINDLLYGLMLRSGNDAAVMLAVATANGMPDFVELMNNKVKELKLKNTIFVNNHGLEEKNSANYSTAYDMAVITKYAMKNKTFNEIFKTKNKIIKTDKKTYSWTNKNKLLFRNDYITGGKTGYTEKAKRTLVTTGSKDNKNLIIVTLNDGNDFANHESLYEKIFKEYISVQVLDKEVTSLKKGNKIIYVKNDYYALVKPNEKDNLSVKYELYKKKVGNKVGVAKVYLNNQLLHEEDLLINKTKTNIITFWQKILKWMVSW